MCVPNFPNKNLPKICKMYVMCIVCICIVDYFTTTTTTANTITTQQKHHHYKPLPLKIYKWPSHIRESIIQKIPIFHYLFAYLNLCNRSQHFFFLLNLSKKNPVSITPLCNQHNSVNGLVIKCLTIFKKSIDFFAKKEIPSRSNCR